LTTETCSAVYSRFSLAGSGAAVRDLVVAADADVARAEVVEDEGVDAGAGFEPEGADRSA
jgi:hypothetical protein